MELTENSSKKKLKNCPQCGVKPGHVHVDGCEIERCSICGLQRISCYCEGNHDRAFARWVGFWPGVLEAKELGIGLQELYEQGYFKIFFVKPSGFENEDSAQL